MGTSAGSGEAEEFTAITLLYCHCLEGQRRAQGFQGEAEGNLPSPSDWGHVSQDSKHKVGSRVEGQSFSCILELEQE